MKPKAGRVTIKHPDDQEIDQVNSYWTSALHPYTFEQYQP